MITVPYWFALLLLMVFIIALVELLRDKAELRKQASFQKQTLLPKLAFLKIAIDFHPLAWKLMQKRKPFVVVANDEPYFSQVYNLIRDYEKHKGRWSHDDECRYWSIIGEAVSKNDNTQNKVG